MDIKLPSETIIKRNEKNNTIHFLKGTNLSAVLEADPEFRKLQSGNSAREIALAFISAYHALLQLADPSEELAAATVSTDDLGLTHVKFRQVYKGIPVWAAEVIVHLDRDKHVYLVQGRYIPTPSQVNTTPVLSEPDAERIVAGQMKMPASGCPHCRSELIIYSETGASASLAYRIDATKNVSESWIYFINASTGSVLEKLSAVQPARFPRM